MKAAPEAIWVPPKVAEDQATSDNGYGCVLYLRSDVSQSLVTDALERAAALCDKAYHHHRAAQDRSSASSTSGAAVLTGRIFAAVEAKHLADEIRALAAEIKL